MQISAVCSDIFRDALGYALMWCDVYVCHDPLNLLSFKKEINVSSEDLDDEMSGLDLQNTQMCRPGLGQKGYE